MELDKIFGLPAHPLLLHIPIVLIPLLGLLAIAMAVRPTWRARLAVPAGVLGFLVMIATLMTAGAGEKLEERVGENPLVERHAELGDQLKIIMIVFGVLLIVLAVVEWRARRTGTALALALPLVLLTAVAGIVATVWTVRAGHAGAKAVWQEDMKKAPAKGGDSDESALPGAPTPIAILRGR